MTIAGKRCLHGEESAQAPDDSDTEEQIRARVAERLRCASRLGCSDAVRCSDDAIVWLRTLLGKLR